MIEVTNRDGVLQTRRSLKEFINAAKYPSHVSYCVSACVCVRVSMFKCAFLNIRKEIPAVMKKEVVLKLEM